MRFCATDFSGQETCTARTFTVNNPPPENDDFENATNLGSASHGFTRDGEKSETATSEPGEPAHFGSSGPYRSVWYRWTAPADGDLTVEVTETEAESDFDSILAAYSGEDLENLTSLASDDDSGVGNRSKISFGVRSGVQYRIAVDDKEDIGGTFSLQGTFEEGIPPANDDQADAIEVGPWPSSATNEWAGKQAGEPSHYGGANPDPDERSVWYRWQAPANGDLTITLNPTGSQPITNPVLAIYRMRPDRGPSTSDERLRSVSGSGTVEASFNVSEGSEYWIAIDSRGGAGTFSLGGTFVNAPDPPPDNDAVADAKDIAEEIDVYDGRVEGINGSATSEVGEPVLPFRGSPRQPERSVWYRWQAPENGTLSISVEAEFSPIFAVYGSADNVLNPTPSQLRALERGLGEGTNTDPPPIDRLQVRKGRNYWIMVDDQAGGGGPFTLSVEFGLAPNNDEREEATIFEGDSNSNSQSVIIEHATGRSVGQGEPKHDEQWDHATWGSVWFEWTPSENGRVDLYLDGDSDYTPRLAAYLTMDNGDLEPVRRSGESRSQIAGVQVRKGAKYLVAVYGDNSRSDRWQLVWDFISAPSNDDFSDARQLDPDPETQGRNISATAEPNEPSHAGPANEGTRPSASVWYRWTAPDDGTMTLRVQGGVVGGSALRTLVSVYDETSSLPEENDRVASADQAGFGAESRVTFPTERGDQYRIAIDGQGGDTGSFDIEGQFVTVCEENPRRDGCARGSLPNFRIDFDRSQLAAKVVRRGKRNVGWGRLMVEGAKPGERIRLVCVDMRCKRAIKFGSRPDIEPRLEQRVSRRGRATIDLRSTKRPYRYLTGKFKLIHFSRPGGPQSSARGKVRTFRVLPGRAGRPGFTYLRSVGRTQCLVPTSDDPDRTVPCQ